MASVTVEFEGKSQMRVACVLVGVSDYVRGAYVLHPTLSRPYQ